MCPLLRLFGILIAKNEEKFTYTIIRFLEKNPTYSNHSIKRTGRLST